MQASYHILFSVALKHSYFQNNSLECMTIAPSLECIQTLNRNGFLFKPSKNGFTILYDAMIAGRIRTREQALTTEQSLRFYMTLNDPYFYSYTTGFTNNAATELFNFYNRKNADNTTTLLQAGDFVSGADLIQVKDAGERFFTKPFGRIDLTLSPEQEPEYVIQFKELSTYWRYHLVSDHLKKLKKPAILRGSEIFEGPLTTELPDASEALTFVSRSPISLSGFANGTNQLVENFEAGGTKHKIIMRALPSPDFTAISSLKGTSKTDQLTYSEIFIF